MLARELRLATPGLVLAGRLWVGPTPAPNAVPVLALHGFQDNAASFDRLAPALLARSGAACREILALDLAGHGHSSWRAPGASYFIMDYVADALAAADALGWDRFVVLGHSLGAAVGTLLGGSAPERLASAVLIDGLGPFSMSAQEAPSLAARALRDRTRRPSRPRVMGDLAEATSVRASARIRIDAEAARLLCARGTRQTREGLVWTADPRLSRPSLSRLTQDTVLAFLRAMAVPTLLIEAEQSVLPSMPAGHYRARLAAHPQLTRQVMPGRHHLHLEATAPRLADSADAFLRAHLSQGSG